jgi:serine/threonine-protein kinase
VPEELLPGAVAGYYRIERKLGEGAMGAVYGAVHPVIGKRVAIKVMGASLSGNLEATERFAREARAACAIEHPHIVDIYSFGMLPDGRPYFVMEWLEGESLAARLRGGGLAFAEGLDVLEQICDALEAVHAEGVVHRDLKPDNVFLTRGPTGAPLVKLLDFGVAKLMRDERAAVDKTRAGAILGTPLYISPEQARGEAVDARTDIYALGVVGYEVVLGRPPFVAQSEVDLLAMHLTRAPPAPRSLWAEVPRPLDELLQRMVAKDAAERPTLTEVRGTLVEVRRLEQQPKGIRRTRWHRIGVAALVGAAAAPLAVLGFRGHGRPVSAPPVVSPTALPSPAPTRGSPAADSRAQAPAASPADELPRPEVPSGRPFAASPASPSPRRARKSRSSPAAASPAIRNSPSATKPQADPDDDLLSPFDR